VWTTGSRTTTSPATPTRGCGWTPRRWADAGGTTTSTATGPERPGDGAHPGDGRRQGGHLWCDARRRRTARFVVRWSPRWSVPECGEVVEADPGGVEGVGGGAWRGARVVPLHDVLLDARLPLVVEDPAEVDDAVAQVREATLDVQVLDVHLADPAAVGPDHVDRVVRPSPGPVQVELEVDQPGIGLPGEDLEA